MAVELYRILNVMDAGIPNSAKRNDIRLDVVRISLRGWFEAWR